MTTTKVLNRQLASIGLRYQPKPQTCLRLKLNLNYLNKNRQVFCHSSRLMCSDVKINSGKLNSFEPKEASGIIGIKTVNQDLVEKDLKVDPNTSDCSLKSDGGDSEVPEIPTTCCMSGCANCVWLDYAEKLAASFTGGQDVILQQMKKIDDPMLKSFIMMELKMKGLIK